MGERELADPCAPAVIVFTSGTSGVPKGVCLSRAALVAATEAHAAALPWMERDRWLLAMPLAHVGGLLVVLRCLAARRAVVLGPDRFEPRALLEAAARGEATLMSLVPTMLERLLPAPPPPSVRAVLLGGAACPPELLARGAPPAGRCSPTYGLSECTAQVCTQRLGGERARGVGPPLPGIEVRVREGVIEVRGPTRMDGYLDEPPLAREEWVRTGDLGALDGEGLLLVFGRADDVIVTGGENVDPLAVEEALRAHPEVDAACVVGVDDVRWGQAVVALIVARDPASPPVRRSPALAPRGTRGELRPPAPLGVRRRPAPQRERKAGPPRSARARPRIGAVRPFSQVRRSAYSTLDVGGATGSSIPIASKCCGRSATRSTRRDCRSPSRAGWRCRRSSRRPGSITCSVPPVTSTSW
ncbi:MAG: AMP-binding protein [Sandaracinaceae bacterium]|nr:AMP-binding protein [Sandaracinaceae bacterium]